MTSSFGITPQRQIRDLVAQPEKPAALPAPAQPSAIPQQVGGQLMYAASYQRDTAAEQGIKNIENFLADNGVFDRGSKALFENYKAEKKQQAERIFASEAAAYRDSLANANETEQLKKKGDFETARQNQLSNPWVNFFYYDTKGTLGGKDIAVNLAAWGKQSAERLAELPEDQRAAAMAEKVQSLSAPYADVPEAFKAAKIDPIVSATLRDLKQDVVNKAYERRAATDRQTAIDKLYGGAKLGAALIKGSFGSKPGLVLGQQALQQGYDDARAYYVDVRGYSEKEFNELMFKEAGRFFIDLDGNQYNDIGEAYGFTNIANSFAAIKTKDGQELLKLRNSKGQTFRELLEIGAQQAVKRSETFAAAEDRANSRARRELTENLKTESQRFYQEYPEPTDEQVLAQRQRLKALGRQMSLPVGMSYADYDKAIDDTYTFRTKDLTGEQEALLKNEIAEEIAQGRTELSGELRSRLEGTKLIGYAITEFGKARRNAGDAGYKSATTSILKNLTDSLKGSFEQDPAVKMMAKEKGEVVTQKKRYLNQAILEAKQRLTAEGTIYIRSELNKAQARGEDISNPAVQLQILERAKQNFFSRPEYNDVDTYYNISEPGKIGVKVTTGPKLGSSKQDSDGRWQININDTDNRAAWAAVAQSTFANNPKAARQYLDNNFVFNNTEMGEINTVLSTGDLTKLSDSARRSLINVQRGFGNKITLGEIVQKQASRFYDGNVPPTFRENALKLQGALRVADSGGGTKPVDSSIIITNWHHNHSDNRAVDFVLQRQNGQISNPVPAPVTGTIVSAGYEKGGFGNSVIIQAASDGPGYRKGDLVRLSHLADIYYTPGQRITRGMPIGKSGNDQPMDSNPRYSSTGSGDPGHVHIQLYRSKGATQQYQYGQELQNDFVRRAYLPLFRSYR